MKRTIDDALSALRQTIDQWAVGSARPSVRILVYPPEWEAEMLHRLGAFRDACAASGRSVELIDVGAMFLEEIQARPGIVETMGTQERDLGADVVLADLAVLAGRRLASILQSPTEPPTVCRLLINTGSLATLVSYSAVTNDTYSGVATPAVVAFPGEGDDQSLSILHLRADTNYRTPRI